LIKLLTPLPSLHPSPSTAQQPSPLIAEATRSHAPAVALALTAIAHIAVLLVHVEKGLGTLTTA
jgi:hypothetical protein